MKQIFSREELSEIFEKKIGVDVYGICLDSKNVKDGDIFVALCGEKVDGHDFIHEACTNGAALIISERAIYNIPDDRLVLSDSSYDSLLKLAKFNINRATHTKYICVTGSVGKTTTKNMLFHILNAEFGKNIYASQKNFNSKIGLTVCAALMPRDTEIAIFEMGMSAAGNIRYLTEIIRPDIAIITNVYPVHLEFFDSVLGIAKAKSEILERSPDYAIIPYNSPYSEFLRKKAADCEVKNIIRFGRNENYDALELNATAAITAANIATGIDAQRFFDHLKSFSQDSNRGGIKYLKNGSIVLIDDSYNASPPSLKSAIKALVKFENMRKILVMGDMKELGDDQKYFHENLSPAIDKYNIDLVFACGELSKYMYDNLRECKRGAWESDADKIAEHVLAEMKNGDCVLVKGSRSMKMEIVANAILEKTS